MKKLPAHFYQNDDVLEIAKSLLGMQLCTCINGELTSGIIVETEAYNGVNDKASHAFGARRTNRTEIMYQEGGVAYVYLCYGMHYLFNIVTGKENEPQAVLIRGLEPLTGIELMLQRRRLLNFSTKISAGPALLTQALGIDKQLNGVSVMGNEVWIEEGKTKVNADAIVSTKRIGVDYAMEDAELPYRFYIEGNAFVSRVLKSK